MPTSLEALSPIERSILNTLDMHRNSTLGNRTLARQIAEQITRDSLERARVHAEKSREQQALLNRGKLPSPVAGFPLTRAKTLTLADL